MSSESLERLLRAQKYFLSSHKRDRSNCSFGRRKASRYSRVGVIYKSCIVKEFVRKLQDICMYDTV
jgi:hypothetical protein